jgi:phage gp29-like protein
MSKLVLGATLTTGEGRRSGSLALGKVHERVRSEYIESDARALMNVINSQLIRWIVDFNFGADTPAPRFVIDTTEDDGLDQEIQVDQELVKMGVPLPLSYFYERYKRPAPLDKEHGLRYDDNNLYQYHIQFGVLTINEVRRTLGLDPVPWGDNPPYSAREIKGKKGLGPAAEEQTREEQERQDREERKREE